MSTPTVTDDLRTPAEWAEHFGVTGLVAEVDYSHATRLAYVDGIFDRDADSGRISMDWETMERIINLSPRTWRGDA